MSFISLSILICVVLGVPASDAEASKIGKRNVNAIHLIKNEIYKLIEKILESDPIAVGDDVVDSTAIKVDNKLVGIRLSTYGVDCPTEWIKCHLDKEEASLGEVAVKTAKEAFSWIMMMSHEAMMETKADEYEVMNRIYGIPYFTIPTEVEAKVSVSNRRSITKACSSLSLNMLRSGNSGAEGSTLFSGTFLQSMNKRYKLAMQGCTLILYGDRQWQIFSTKTHQQPAGHYCKLDLPNGDMVIRNHLGTTVWAVGIRCSGHCFRNSALVPIRLVYYLGVNPTHLWQQRMAMIDDDDDPEAFRDQLQKIVQQYIEE